MKNHTNLARFLAGLALSAPLALAQDTPSTTPREVFERAYYAEAHEHDLAAAASGYRATIEAARAAGLGDLVKEAEAALTRVRVRLGEIEAPAVQDGKLPDDLVGLFEKAAAVPSLESEAAGNVTRDMALYGDAAVPLLEQWLTLPRGSGTYQSADGRTQILSSPYIAAMALGRIGSAKARAALLTGYASPDPQLRRAILFYAPAECGELFARGIDDSVGTLRELASSRLCVVNDVSVVPALEVLLRRGDVRAGGPIGELDPSRALVLLEDPGFTDATANSLLGGLGSRSWGDVTPDQITAAFRVLATSSNARVIEAAHATLNRALPSFDRSPRRAELLDALEAGIRAATGEVALMYLTPLGADRALECVRAFVKKEPGPFDEQLEWRLQITLEFVMKSGEDRAALGEELYVAIAAKTNWRALTDGSVWSGGSALSLFSQVAKSNESREIQTERVLRMFTATSPEARPELVFPLARWVQSVYMQDDGTGTFAAQPLDPRLADIGRYLARVDTKSLRNNGSVRNSGSPSSVEVAALSVLRYTNAADGLEVLFSNPTFPDSGTAQRDLAPYLEQIAASDADGLMDLLVAEFSKRSAESQNRYRAEVLIQLGVALKQPLADQFIDRLWALELTPELRAAAYGRYMEAQTGDASLAKLLELYPTVPDSTTGSRVGAIKRFGDNLYEPAIDLLGEALRDRDQYVRKAAQAAFESFRAQRDAIAEYESWRQASEDARDTVAQLVELLADNNRDVVRGAVEALGVVKARTALPQLVALLARDDAELKAAVNKAIAAIGG